METPAFVWMAKAVVLFRNAYTPNAKCVPPRCSVLTGRNSWQLEEAANFEDLLGVAGEQPWFFWYVACETHRRYEYGSGMKAGKSIAEIDRVSALWPDNEIVRNDILDYAFQIEHAGDWDTLGDLNNSAEIV